MNPWIIYSQPRPSASLRLFVFPHAGGGSGGFRNWANRLGGGIPFEAMRKLRRRGDKEAAHLFVAACPAPQLPWPHPFMHGLETAQFLEEMQKRYGGIPRQILEEEELCALLLPMLRADITMLETYSYVEEVPLDSGI